MDKYAVWVKAKLQEEDSNGWSFDYDFVYQLTKSVRESYVGEEVSMEEVEAVLIALYKQESESPVDRGVEKAEDYAAIRYPFVALEEKSLVADNAIIEACRIAYIAGAKLAANDADYWKQKYEGVKERCEAAENILDDMGVNLEFGYKIHTDKSLEVLSQHLKHWQTLKQKQL